MQHATPAELKDIPLFHAVGEQPLSQLAARTARRRLGAGELVFKEGAPADSLYVIVSGSVKIFVADPAGEEIVLDVKKAGEYFGEMMLDHRPRSASIVTLEPSEFLTIRRDDLRAFLAGNPEAAEHLVLNLIRATRGMNERVKQYVKGLDQAKPVELPTVRRWHAAKRWVLIGLLALAIGQFYFMDTLLQIVTTPGLTVLPGR
jgi:CRP-like cAMP-binding protein